MQILPTSYAESQPLPHPSRIASREERELRSLFFDLFFSRQSWDRTQTARRDFAGRKICVTVYSGHYGNAGHVICLEGSPPRGTLLVPRDLDAVSGSVVFWNNARPRLLGIRQSRIVRVENRGPPPGVCRLPRHRPPIFLLSAKIANVAGPPRRCDHGKR